MSRGFSRTFAQPSFPATSGRRARFQGDVIGLGDLIKGSDGNAQTSQVGAELGAVSIEGINLRFRPIAGREDGRGPDTYIPPDTPLVQRT